MGTRVETIPLDDYVLGAVRAELSPEMLANPGLSRLLQVQALVSRTYALANLGRHEAEGFDLCDGTHCQMFRRARAQERPDDTAAQAVAATHRDIITFDGKPILAVFHANCGGHTAAADQVWSGHAVPYLRPVPDWFCSRASNAGWTFEIDDVRLVEALNGDPLTAVGARLDRIDISARDAAGRATRVTLVGATSPQLRAEEFRTVLRRTFGPRSLQSTWFSVTRDGHTFRFTGTGYGHGVGLCQAGAAARAQAGESAEAIVAHYFPGTRIEAVETVSLPPSRPAGRSRTP
jgi:stage II sporulation protein D